MPCCVPASVVRPRSAQAVRQLAGIQLHLRRAAPAQRCSVPDNRHRRHQRRLQPAAAANQQAALESYTGARELPKKMNATPHAREMRRFFYEDACAGVLAGAAAGLTRMSVRLTVPETDVTTDVYRVGTLLELVRELAASLAQDGRRVKVCVQQSLGQGVFQGLPLSLSGVSRIAASMDWGQAAEFVSFGQYGRDQVEGDDSDFYVCIAPQNVEGDSIQPFLQEMVEAAEAKGKAMVLVNPRLADIPSANGVMGVRGRGDRMAFTASFEPAYHFRLLYVSGQLWPIRGALRYCYGGDAARWEVYKRIDLGRRLGELEEYRLLGVYEREPDGKIITAAFTAANRNANG